MHPERFLLQALGGASVGSPGGAPSFPSALAANPGPPPTKQGTEGKTTTMQTKSQLNAALAFAAAVLVVAGCASSGAAKDGNKSNGVQAEFQKWASKRAPVEQVVSKSSDPQVAAIVNGLAVIPGEVYGYLAEGSDKAMARNAGREIYLAIKRDLDAGTPMADIVKTVSAEDLDAAVAYSKFVKEQDYATLGQKLAGIASKLASDGAKVADAVNQIKNLDSMKGKNPMALAMAMKGPTSEINTIKSQLSDAVKAVGYWQDLNKQDEQMQKFCQEYPIEK